MIYLRTGGNGSCKTLFTLFDVREMQVKEQRPVYFVKNRFTPKPILTEVFAWTAIEFKDWESCEDGAIIICDEVHYDIPLRSQSSTPPDHIAHLTEHRKRGFDFFMLTQHPMNIDAFVRRLVQAPGWHEHLKVVFGGTKTTKVLHWDAVNAQCEKDGSEKSAQVTTRTQPKEVYDWYESSTRHTAKVRIPKQLWTLLICLVALIVVVYFVWQQLKPKPTSAPVASSSPAAAAAGVIAPPAQAGERKPMTAAEYVVAHRPRIAGLMHTAPIYDPLTEPKRVPLAAACIMSASKGCKCFTQDATPYPIDESMCRGLVEHGTFYAFTQPQPPQPAPPVYQQASEPATARAEPLVIGSEVRGASAAPRGPIAAASEAPRRPLARGGTAPALVPGSPS